MQVASAFSQMLNLHNLSEEISNAQIEKASRIGEVRRRVKPMKPRLAVTMTATQPLYRDPAQHAD